MLILPVNGAKYFFSASRPSIRFSVIGSKYVSSAAMMSKYPCGSPFPQRASAREPIVTIFPWNIVKSRSSVAGSINTSPTTSPG